MITCEECNKELGLLQGYRHPALGKRFPVCQKCYTKISNDMQRWSTFCYSDASKSELSKKEIEDAWNTTIANNPPLQKWFTDLWKKIGLQNVPKTK
jgi:hypothetical protein